MEAKDRIVFALDVPSYAEAMKYVDLLQGHVGYFKVGLELFTACGPQLLDRLWGRNLNVVLDLKLHDIPETVERTARAIDSYECVKYFTVHVQQRETIQRLSAANLRATPLYVTVLTSMTQEDLIDLELDANDFYALEARVELLAAFAAEHGARGFVCGAPNVGILAASVGPGTTLMVPGIRPVRAEHNDQKQVGTPAQAISGGASLLVIGRPIRDAADPVAAAQAIAKEIEAALAGR